MRHEVIDLAALNRLPVAERRGRLLRLRGRPAVAGARVAASGGWSTSSAWSRSTAAQPQFRAFWAHDRRRGEAGPHRLRRPRLRSPRAVARPARLPLRTLRAGSPAADGGTARGLRGRGRPAAASAGLRRPLRRRQGRRSGSRSAPTRSRSSSRSTCRRARGRSKAAPRASSSTTSSQPPRSRGASTRPARSCRRSPTTTSDDCVSTLLLRNWLLDRCLEHGGSPAGPAEVDAVVDVRRQRQAAGRARPRGGSALAGRRAFLRRSGPTSSAPRPSSRLPCSTTPARTSRSGRSTSSGCACRSRTGDGPRASSSSTRPRSSMTGLSSPRGTTHVGCSGSRGGNRGRPPPRRVPRRLRRTRPGRLSR